MVADLKNFAHDQADKQFRKKSYNIRYTTSLRPQKKRIEQKKSIKVQSNKIR
jgi:hypothetical protein